MTYMDRSRFWACDFWALLAILTCSCLLSTASGDPRTAVAGQFCGNSSSLSASGDSLDQSVCTTGNNSSSSNNFGKAVREVIGNVTAEAIRNKGFAVGSASVSNTSAYALAQCWRNLTQSQCSTCLNAAASSMVSVLPAVEDHAVLFAGCYMRYSTKLFWNVYPNGSSSSDANHEKNLAWEQRIDIVQGVAEELSYLRKESKTRIIHRDIKATNIPLDDKFKPKITDFDRTRALFKEKTNVSIKAAIRRTLLGRKFARRQSLNEYLLEKAEAEVHVFVFGLLVFETMTGKRRQFWEQRPEVWYHYDRDTLEQIVDKRINQENTKECIRHVIKIGLLCTDDPPRTTMAAVVGLLREPRHCN